MQLPMSLTNAIEQKLGSRATIQRSALELSQRYRSAGTAPTGLPYIQTSEDVLAYLSVRMPATYAVAARVFGQLAARCPSFSPTSLLDLGAGPATASLAALSRWETLHQFRLIERDKRLVEVGAEFAELLDAPIQLKDWSIEDVTHLQAANVGSFDMVVVSYVLCEITQSQRERFIQSAWEATDGVLLIIEPGTSQGHQRLLRVRKQLLAAGATTLAPCPHDLECPLEKVADRWCHFGARVNRSKVHREIKGGTLSFEDEPYSYVAFSRQSLDQLPQILRLIDRPKRQKGAVSMSVCTPEGLDRTVIRRSDGQRYKQAKSLAWGDSFSMEPTTDSALEDTV